MIFEITIDDTLINIICAYLKYPLIVDGEPNTESKKEFLIRKMTEHPQNIYEAGRNEIDKVNKPNRLADLESQKTKITGREIIT